MKFQIAASKFQFKVSVLNFEVSDQSLEVRGARVNLYDCKGILWPENELLS